MPHDGVPFDLLEDKVEVRPTQEENPKEEEPRAVPTMDTANRGRHEGYCFPVKCLEARGEAGD